LGKTVGDELKRSVADTTVKHRKGECPCQQRKRINIALIGWPKGRDAGLLLETKKGLRQAAAQC